MPQRCDVASERDTQKVELIFDFFVNAAFSTDGQRLLMQLPGTLTRELAPRGMCACVRVRREGFIRGWGGVLICTAAGRNEVMTWTSDSDQVGILLTVSAHPR